MHKLRIAANDELKITLTPQCCRAVSGYVRDLTEIEEILSEKSGAVSGSPRLATIGVYL